VDEFAFLPMWCSTCQQDVPGVSHSASGRLACSRCGRPLKSRKTAQASGICDGGIALDERPAMRASAAPPKLDDWNVRHEARRLGRELRRPAGASAPPRLDSLPQSRRLDPPADLFDRPAPSVSPIGPAARRSQGGQAIAWMLVMTGLVALVGGIGGIAWSLAAERGEFWNASLGLTLAGQGTLILGLVVVVSRLWRNSRYATTKLQEVHARLGELQRSADALAANRGGAPAFYADLARGAPPQMLLSNLKGQIDQLATRFGSAN
jgi:hypothetical protein